MPFKANNPCNKANFEAAISLFKVVAPKNEYKLEEIYLDYGAGMKWETIVCYRGINDHYQMLCPRDWDKLQAATTPEQIAAIVRAICEDQKGLLRI